MAGKLAILRQRILRVKPWIMVATLLAVAIFGYYVFLGIRFWSATGQTPIVTARIAQYQQAISGELPDETPLEIALVAQEDRLTELRSLYSYPSSDDLVAILSSTAQEAGIQLTSVTVGDAQQEVKDGIQFTIQPVNIAIVGELTPIYAWLELLHERVPVVSIEGFRVASLDNFPSARINLAVFLSPTTTQEDEAGR